MSMSTAQIKEIMNKHGGPESVIAFIFDNEYAHYFVGNDKVFSEDMLVTMGGVETIKLDAKLNSAKTGMNDIPITVYKPVEDIQGMLVVNNLSDKENIDKYSLIMR